MNAIGQRIKKLRKLHKLTQTDVASYIGVQRVSVSKWESQNDVFNTPKGEHLFKLSEILKTTVQYLLYGETKYQHSPTNDQTTATAQEQSAVYLNKIPLIGWSQLQEGKELENRNLKYQQTIFSHQTLSELSYALPVIGDSMTSGTGPYSFPEGVLIIFDPLWGGELFDNMFVIAKVNADMIFRQVKFDGSKPYLNALNPQYPKIFKAFELIGKVTEMQMKLP